jgi:hypothetical protein
LLLAANHGSGGLSGLDLRLDRKARMVGWDVSPEFYLLKTAGKQRPSQIQIKNPFRPLGVSPPPPQQIVDLGVNK